MASAFRVHRQVAEVSRRLLALLEESVAPAKAVQLLVAESILPAQASVGPALPLSAAIASIIPHPGTRSDSVASVAAYVGNCESQGRGEAVLRLLGRLKIRRAQGRTSLGVIGVEFVLLMLVLVIHSIFVLPQFQTLFDSVNTPMPAFTRMVFALIGPSGPFIWVGGLGLLILLVWRIFPFVFGPLLPPIDRLLLALPLIGPRMRQGNSDRISGWLGFAAADASSQQAAIEAAQSWYSGDPLSRECAEVLHAVSSGKDIFTCLMQARGFDREFGATVAFSDREDSLVTLRARWRSVETLPEFQSSLTPALAQIVLGVVVAAVVIAMYLPLFKMASLL